jgi:hypothetical protein
MSNMRRRTKGLNTDQVKELNYAWHHAATIGRPLNAFLTIRPIDIDDMSPGERCRVFSAIRNKLGVYARLRGFEPAFIWSREANPDGTGTGEHLHVLMHIPAKHRADFEKTVFDWLPGAAEVDVGKAHQRTRIASNGKRHSAVGYISKQMTPQAWYGRGLNREPGGPILGKRGGTTKNLDRRARAAFRASWPAYTVQRAQPSTSRAPDVQNSATDGASVAGTASPRMRAGVSR